MPLLLQLNFSLLGWGPGTGLFINSTADSSVWLARTSAPSRRPECSLSTCHGPCFSPSLLRSCLFLGRQQGFVTLPGKSCVSVVLQWGWGRVIHVAQAVLSGTESHISLVQVLTVSLAALVEGGRWPGTGSRKARFLDLCLL